MNWTNIAEARSSIIRRSRGGEALQYLERADEAAPFVLFRFLVPFVRPRCRIFSISVTTPRPSLLSRSPFHLNYNSSKFISGFGPRLTLSSLYPGQFAMRCRCFRIILQLLKFVTFDLKIFFFIPPSLYLFQHFFLTQTVNI